MSKRKFTESQQAAIDTRDKTLLVSAAAGSGKTATLIERIVQSVLDKDNPTDINKMLIVTFTKAAAAELRTKISKALREALAEEPDNKRLERQLYLLPSAAISTIDAFCNSILKNNTERFGVSPKYRIADPIEAKILSHTVWSTLIEAAYSGKLENISSDAFEYLAETITSVKSNSELEDIFNFLYEKSKTHENGVEIFTSFAESVRDDIARPIEESKYIKFAIRRAKEISEHFIKLAEQARLRFPEEETGNADISMYTAFFKLIAKSENFSEIREHIINASAIETRSTKKTASPELLACIERIKSTLGKCLERYFSFPAEEWKRQLEKLSCLLFTIAEFTKVFDSVYFEEKRQRSILEYSDIEMLTYKSLYNSDGTLTDFAMSMKGELQAVYIDEYQDVNSIQNKIFAAVSTEKNRFMVGDIKQSIYVFRNARPDIFAEMKNTFPPLDKAEDSDFASIFMSENFRCDEVVINLVNGIFDKMFTLFGKSIGYVPEDRLKYSKVNDTATEKIIPVLHIFVDSEEKKKPEESEDEELTSPSAHFTAKKIKELISCAKLNNGEPVRAGDIAILLRNGVRRINLYKDALAELGIRSKAADDKSFFLNSEIQLALCLLNTIDNPRRDIYLAGLMHSPLYSFTPDELYLIRRADKDKNSSLWQSLTKYCNENPSFEKGIGFVNTINRYRSISEGVKIDALILRLYHETGLLALAKRDGKEENLMLLYNYARKFEASSFEGLYSFIKYINEVIASGATIPSVQSDDGGDAVTIITAHKSKGLEYPIVFIAGAETSFDSGMDARNKISYSDEYGIAMKTRSELGYALIESPIRNVITDSNTERSIEEELRVYYVALTRARERLFIVGELGNKRSRISRSKYEASLIATKMAPSRQTLWEIDSLIDMIMFTEPEINIIFEEKENYASLASSIDFEKSLGNNIIPDGESFEEAYEILTERFSFKYPYEHITTLPEKMSVSRLYPAVLDEMDSEEFLSLDKREDKHEGRLGILPEFISGGAEEESARRGIATHTFLQFFDISLLDENGAEIELKRLIEKRFISKENAARVRLDEINLFEKSKLYSEMKNAARLYREFRFSVMLPASLFTESDEKAEAYGDSEILLQGVIDCIIEDSSGNLHLIDYKTDRLSESELLDRALAESKLSAKHSLQLFYYALAIEKIFGKKPITKRVYSLPLGDTVEMK